MADEIAAAQAVVDATVSANVAQGEAAAASSAAIVAEVAASEAAEAAREVEEMADRAIDRAAIEAADTIETFRREVASCQSEILSLRSTLEQVTASNLSISEQLSRLMVLEELEPMATAARMQREAAEHSGTSSGTDGSTPAPGGGPTSQQESESGAPARNPEGAEQPVRPASSEEASEAAPARPAKRRRVWL